MVHLSEKTRSVLVASYPFLRENSEDISYRMYDLLFSKYPAFKSKFNRSREYHPDLLATAISGFAENNFRIDGEFKQSLKKISHNHSTRHIQHDDYPLLQECFLQAMNDVLFDQITSDIHDAWAEAYNVLASFMIHEDQLLSEQV